MSKFSKIKIPLLLVVGVAVAAAILAGAGLVGGLSSASDRAAGVWRELPDAPAAIASAARPCGRGPR